MAAIDSSDNQETRKPAAQKTCEICNKVYSARRPHQKYCGDICKRTHDNRYYTKTYRPALQKCEVCGEEYLRKRHNQKYCSKECSPHFSVLQPTTCKECGKEYLPRRSNQIYCDIKCQSHSSSHKQAPNNQGSQKTQTPRQKRQPPGTHHAKGRYVYLWFKDDEIFPFYVGKGVGNRAVVTHTCHWNGVTLWAPCERMRQSARKFNVVIVRDNLTNEGASLLESSFIQYFTKMGVILTNQATPQLRQEIPPLALEK